MNKLKKLLFISSALLLSTANNTFAVGPTTGTITASGTVTGTCTVTASNMAFGTLSTSATTNIATSTVTATCTDGTAWVVTNAGDTNSLYLNSNSGAGDSGTILFPIVLTGGSTAFTLTNAGTGRLTGTGNGSAQTATPTLTATAGSSTGKTAGIYGGTVTLNITY
jgi:spore coat protein U-like protein